MFKDFLIANLAFFTQCLKKDLTFFYRYFVATGRFFVSANCEAGSNDVPLIFLSKQN
jgi:hypothetical protein